MTSQKQTNDNSPKGFAGLASMLSDVDDVITPNETQKPEPLEKMVVDANKPNASIPSQQTSKNSSKLKNWVVALGIILGLISLVSEFNNKSATLLEKTKAEPTRNIFTFAAPDGKEYDIEAPEGATQEEALDYLVSNWDTLKDMPSANDAEKVNESTKSSRKTKAIATDSADLLSDAKAMVISMIDYALIDGGLKNESEIQKIQKRITALPKPIKTNIKEARDFNNNGLALVKKEKYDEAVKFFKNGNVLNPADIEIVGNLGFAYVKLNQLDSAQQAMMTSLAMAPNRATAWANLGDVYALKNDKSRAVACLANAYRFSRNREKTHQFFKSLNEKENVEQLKQARNEAMTWADKTYFQVLKEDNKRNIWAEYKDTKTGFKISYPVNWVVKKIEEPKVKFFAAFKTDKEEGDCDVALIPNDIFLNMTQEDINRKLEGLPDSDQPDWSKLSLAPEVNIKQIENRKFKKSDMLMYSATVEITSNKSEEKWTRKQNNTLTFTPGFIWAIHCGVSSNDANKVRVRFTEFQPIFNDFLRSFSFLKH
jgi:tetratricopeptide (TPR) repeat protein